MADLQLICSDCGQEFTFLGEEQEFFRERGYPSPKRCKPCRQAKKNEQSSGARYQTKGGAKRKISDGHLTFDGRR